MRVMKEAIFAENIKTFSLNSIPCINHKKVFNVEIKAIASKKYRFLCPNSNSSKKDLVLYLMFLVFDETPKNFDLFNLFFH